MSQYQIPLHYKFGYQLSVMQLVKGCNSSKLKLPGLSPTLVDATSAATVVVSVPFTKIYVLQESQRLKRNIAALILI